MIQYFKNGLIWSDIFFKMVRFFLSQILQYGPNSTKFISQNDHSWCDSSLGNSNQKQHQILDNHKHRIYHRSLMIHVVLAICVLTGIVLIVQARCIYLGENLRVAISYCHLLKKISVKPVLRYVLAFCVQCISPVL